MGTRERQLKVSRKRSKMFNVLLDVRYDGSTNLLEMSRDYRIKYKCSFDVSDTI